MENGHFSGDTNKSRKKNVDVFHRVMSMTKVLFTLIA